MLPVGLQVSYLFRSHYRITNTDINIGHYLCREIVTCLRISFDENILTSFIVIKGLITRLYPANTSEESASVLSHFSQIYTIEAK